MWAQLAFYSDISYFDPLSYLCDVYRVQFCIDWYLFDEGMTSKALIVKLKDVLRRIVKFPIVGAKDVNPIRRLEKYPGQSKRQFTPVC